jgi:hypothetical protein
VSGSFERVKVEDNHEHNGLIQNAGVRIYVGGSASLKQKVPGMTGDFFRKRLPDYTASDKLEKVKSLTFKGGSK